MMNRKDFGDLCEGASGMLAALAKQAGNLAFPNEPLIFDKNAMPETVALLAKVICAIVESAD